jgi:uncharacterized protein
MPHIEKHAPGAFCWIELGTSDQNAAKSFYTSLFGWTFEDFPMGPSDFYTIFKLNGRDAAAAYTLRPQEREQNVPPHWNLYIAVESADDKAKRAAELGAKVMAQPFDVFDAGRMAVIQDPTGAVFCIWQPLHYQGMSIMNENDTFCWADLATRDQAAASRFYSGLFGWEIDGGKESGYLHIKNGEDYIGGILPHQFQSPNAPPHWLSYFYVADVDAKTDRARQLGAQIYSGPMTMEGVGRMTVIADPHGAVFALFKAMPKE